jgi:hypothetical protein
MLKQMIIMMMLMPEDGIQGGGGSAPNDPPKPAADPAVEQKPEQSQGEEAAPEPEQPPEPEKEEQESGTPDPKSDEDQPEPQKEISELKNGQTVQVNNARIKGECVVRGNYSGDECSGESLVAITPVGGVNSDTVCIPAKEIIG